MLLAPSSATGALVASAAFQEGRVTIQGETALRAAELLCVQPGERVLDLCAAPGGKTAALARAGGDVLALDRNATRLAPMATHLSRLGVTARAAACDGVAGLRPDAAFDAALVDAPCSNTGVLAARPGARWRFGPAARADLEALQARLLEEAAAHAPRVVYSVCSIEPEEGPRRVRAFVEAHPEWRVEEEHETLPAEEGPVDGGYAARLRR